MIRVWIETSSTFARAGFESLLEGSLGVELAASVREADVILREELPDAPEPPGGVPMVVVTHGALTPRALRSGVRAILPREASPEQIAAALLAASAGLVAVPVDAGALVASSGSSEADIEPLTPREMEVLEMLAEGFGNKQIAARLNISEHTAKFHVNSILGKLHAGTRTEAVMRGIRSGLLKV